MKLPAFFLFFFCFFSQILFAFDHSLWTLLLKKHVRNGFVDYQNFLNDKTKLNNYLDEINALSEKEFLTFTREDQIALWINLYNATVIQLILDYYPVKSVNEIPGFWNEPNVRVANQVQSLRKIEEEIIRQRFRDERATLCLVSGKKSSPPLRNEAYEGSRLLDQMKDQINFFLSDERWNQIRPKKKKLKISSRLQELRNDFLLGYGTPETDQRFKPDEMAILSFIRIHTTDPDIKKWIETRSYKLKYLPEDSSLNQIHETDEKN